MKKQIDKAFNLQIKSVIAFDRLHNYIVTERDSKTFSKINIQESKIQFYPRLSIQWLKNVCCMYRSESSSSSFLYVSILYFVIWERKYNLLSDIYTDFVVWERKYSLLSECIQTIVIVCGWYIEIQQTYITYRDCIYLDCMCWYNKTNTLTINGKLAKYSYVW